MSEKAISEEKQTYYHEIGGQATFRHIAAIFYQEVRQEPILLPLYPEQDMDGAERRLWTFLQQYWGGPRTYSEERGHPRLRMRHAPFAIGQKERDAWLRCMTKAIDSVAPEIMNEAHRQQFLEYARNAATAMVNTSIQGDQP